MVHHIFCHELNFGALIQSGNEHFDVNTEKFKATHLNNCFILDYLDRRPKAPLWHVVTHHRPYFIFTRAS
ncbi:unnamed protein product [Caenorhabditis nigoni]